jgi:hypothetical protein
MITPDNIAMESCTLCRGDVRVLYPRVRDSSDHGVVECMVCGYVQLAPMPTVNEMLMHAALQTQRRAVHGGMTREQKRHHAKADTERRVETVLRYFPQNVFDFGTGNGFFVEAMRERGIDARGYEVGGAWPSASSYNVVTIHHVLEHLRTPYEILRLCENLIIEKGFIIVEVPNHACEMMNDSQFPDYMFWHYQFAHAHYFTPVTLLQTAMKAGFPESSIDVTGVQRYGLGDYIAWQEGTAPRQNVPVCDNGEERWAPDEWNQRFIAWEQKRKHMEEGLTCDTLVMTIRIR